MYDGSNGGERLPRYLALLFGLLHSVIKMSEGDYGRLYFEIVLDMNRSMIRRTRKVQDLLNSIFGCRRTSLLGTPGVLGFHLNSFTPGFLALAVV